MAPTNTGSSALPPLGLLCAVAGTLGVASHLMYFIKGEHHQESVRYIQLLFLVPIVITYGFFSLTHDVGGAVAASTALTSSWLGGLFASMLVYRVFFHQLRKFPGPFMYKTSKLWHVAQLGELDNFRKLDAMHKTYGEYVRVGPNEVSITDPDAVDAVLGPRSKCYKAPWYDLSLPLVSLHNARDRQIHSKRRRVWDKGFNAESLRNYESRVVGFANTFMDQLKNRGSEGLNMSKWFMFYSFDVMGELAFGKSFDMLTSGQSHFAMDLLHEGTTPIGIFTPAPWLFIILSKIPFLAAGFMRFINYCNDQVEKRKKNKPQEPDIMSYLLDVDQTSAMGDEETNKLWLTGDSRLVIVAGSDTTAATMTHIFYRLCKDPSHIKKLREELDPLVENQQLSSFNVAVVEKCDHLNGVINEGLRLFPPVPSGVLRVTPADGLKVGENFVPPHTTIGIPMYTVNRSAKVCERPEEFIPERWYSKPELVKHQRAFAPFSLGPYGCIGKGLALMELRTIITLLVTQFDVQFAPGEDGSAFINDSKDMFTIALADLNLKFTPRKK